jgi:hypothetical protein
MQIEERVRRLERSGKVWRAVAVVLGVALIAAAGRGPVSDEVVTRSILVVDKRGDAVFAVGPTMDGGTKLELKRKGVAVCRLQSDDTSTLLGLNVPGADKPSVMLTADSTSGTIAFQPTIGLEKGTTTSMGSMRGEGFIQLRGARGEKAFEKP